MLCQPNSPSRIGNSFTNTSPPTQEWQGVSGEVIKNIVVVKFCHTRPFDGEDAGTSEATGFVVNAKEGYVLTNRHVAGPGPFWGSCIFGTQYNIPCEPLYIDPVHDFAFLQYDPRAVRDLPIRGLSLSRMNATVGQPVLVVGNDAGQTLSIIPGVISRVDRNAPEYAGSYSDFNINYYQANMNLSGGISGSPVIGVDGSVIGIVSGSLSRGAICYILPIACAHKALTHLCDKTPIPRGDIQCQFTLTSLHECRQLGFGPPWGAQSCGQENAPSKLLVAKTVLENGPASRMIVAGDILLEVEGHPISGFDQLEDIFNLAVGLQVSITLCRDGDKVTSRVKVTNLYAITPASLLSVGGLYCHDVSYVQAMKHGIPLTGVYITESKEPVIVGDGLSGWTIIMIDGRFIKRLDELFCVLKTLEKGQRILLTYAHVESLHVRKTITITIDAHDGITVATRDPTSNTWRGETVFLSAETLPEKQDGVSSADRSLPYRSVSKVLAGVSALKNSILPCRPVASIIPSLIHVESRAYLYLDGHSAAIKQGVGVVVAAKAGLVVVSRFVIPHKGCHITLTLGSTKVEGRCLFWHPHYCYVVVQFDAALVSNHIHSIRLSSRRVALGRKVKFVHFAQPEHILHGDALVLSTTTTKPPIIEDFHDMKDRPINANLVGIDALSEKTSTGGVLTAANGSVLAFWLPSIGGIASPKILPIVSRLQQGLSTPAYVFPASLDAISLDTSRIMGVPQNIRKSIAATSQHPQMYRVARSFCTLAKAGDHLIEGDVMISLDGQRCKTWNDFEVTSLRTIKAVIWRGATLRGLEIETACVDDLETKRCIEFCGAYIQPPPLSIRLGLDHIPSEVFVNHILAGSPAEHFYLPCESFITAINGTSVRDFDSFVGMVRLMPKDRSFTIMATMLTGVKAKRTCTQNNDHFPFVEWDLDSLDKQILGPKTD